MNKTDNLIQEIFSGKKLSYFLAGWIVLGVLGNAFFSFVTKGIETYVSSNLYAVWFLTGLMASGALWFTITQLRKSLYQQTTKLLVNTTHPEKHKGLIVLISRIETSRKAIGWHIGKLENCWLICSETSEQSAITLKAEFGAKIPNEIKIIIVKDEEVYEPVVFKKKIEEIFEQLPNTLKEEDVILDFTGMTVPASVGSLLAFIGSEKIIQYIPAVNTAKLEEVGSHEPIQFELNLKTTKTKVKI